MILSLWGIGFANGIYKVGIERSIFDPNGIVQGVYQPGAFYGFRDFAKQYTTMSYCAQVANDLYGADVRIIQGVPDKQIMASGTTTSYYYMSDRNTSTNLAGGDPVCGTVQLSIYESSKDPGNNLSITTTTDGTQTTGTTADTSLDTASANTNAQINTLRETTQKLKVTEAQNLMSQIDGWVSSWPKNNAASQTGWTIESSTFNDLVTNSENTVLTQLYGSFGPNATDNGVQSSLQQYISSLTEDGWAMSAGWFQRVGLIRSKLMSVLAEPAGTASIPTYSGLPDDSRQKALVSTVGTVTDAVFKKAEDYTKTNYGNGSNKPVSSADIASALPTTSTSKSLISVTAIKSDMDGKMSSWLNQKMETLVSAATGSAPITSGSGTAGNYMVAECGMTATMGGSINRIKCVGDFMTAAYAELKILRWSIMTTVAAVRIGLGTASSFEIFGNKADSGQFMTPLWDWVMSIPVVEMEKIVGIFGPMAFYFSTFLPSLPYTIFIIVVVGWVLAVLQAIIAAPLWAMMHMTPDRTFVGSQTQGYLLLLSVFVRPALAVLGLFAAFLVADPIIHYITKAFFTMRGAVVSSTGILSYTEFVTFAWWFWIYGAILLPVLYMIFGLPQTMPDHILRWLGAGIGDLGETNAVSETRRNMVLAHASGGGTGQNRMGNFMKGMGQLTDNNKKGGGGATDAAKTVGGTNKANSAKIEGQDQQGVASTPEDRRLTDARGTTNKNANESAFPQGLNDLETKAGGENPYMSSQGTTSEQLDYSVGDHQTHVDTLAKERAKANNNESNKPTSTASSTHVEPGEKKHGGDS